MTDKRLENETRERITKEASYIVSTGCTVREAAKKFGVSKTTLHKDVVERLWQFDFLLYIDVEEVLQKNKAERHIRGGMATKEKYSRLKQQA